MTVMSETAVTRYEYQGVAVEVQPGVFQPNKTTEMLLEAALKHSLEGKIALDLGCGSGIIGLSLKKLGNVRRGCGSDISDVAVKNARENAARLGLDMDFRSGSLFEPWGDEQFDVILDDVSGVAEPIARLSPWYPPEIHCDAGLDGSEWTTKVLESAHGHLKPGGALIFATVSLSNEVRILEVARSRFPRVECLLKKSWPFKEDFWQRIRSNEAAWRLVDQGIIKVFQRGSRFLWDTTVYIAWA